MTYWYQTDTLGSVRMHRRVGQLRRFLNYRALWRDPHELGQLSPTKSASRASGPIRSRGSSSSGLEPTTPATGTFLLATPGASPRPTARASGSICIPSNDPVTLSTRAGMLGHLDQLQPAEPAHPGLSSAAHLALGAATFVPGIGSAAAVADAGLYAYEGDYAQAALSLVSAVPGAGVVSAGEKAFTAIDKAANVVNEGEKAFKAIDKAESAVNDFNKVEKAESATALARRLGRRRRDIYLDHQEHLPH